MSDREIASRVFQRYAAKGDDKPSKPEKNPGELVSAINRMVKKVDDAAAACAAVHELFKKYPVTDHDIDFKRGKEAEAMMKLLTQTFKKFEDSPLLWDRYVEHPMNRSSEK